MESSGGITEAQQPNLDSDLFTSYTMNDSIACLWGFALCPNKTDRLSIANDDYARGGFVVEETGASAYMERVEYAVAARVNLYFSPFVIFFGTVGSVLTFVVTTRKHNRRLSACFYMAVLAAVDGVVLWLLLATDWLFFNFLQESNSVHLCKTFLFLDNCLSDYGCWLVVAMTTDRFLAVTFPLHVQLLCKVARAQVATAILFLVAVAKNLHLLWTAVLRYDKRLEQQACIYTSDNRLFMEIYPWFDTCAVSLVPFLLLLILNSIIIYRIRVSVTERVKLGTTKSTYRSGTSKGSRARASRTPSTEKCGSSGGTGGRQRQLTLMLMMISVLFVVLTLPRKVHIVVWQFKDPAESSRSAADFFLSHVITEKLWYANSAVHFYLYLICGSRFRVDLGAILGAWCPCWRRKDGHRAARTASHLCRTSVDQVSPGHTPLLRSPMMAPDGDVCIGSRNGPDPVLSSTARRFSTIPCRATALEMRRLKANGPAQQNGSTVAPRTDSAPSSSTLSRRPLTYHYSTLPQSTRKPLGRNQGKARPSLTLKNACANYHPDADDTQLPDVDNTSTFGSSVIAAHERVIPSLASTAVAALAGRREQTVAHTLPKRGQNIYLHTLDRANRKIRIIKLESLEEFDFNPMDAIEV